MAKRRRKGGEETYEGSASPHLTWQSRVDRSQPIRRGDFITAQRLEGSERTRRSRKCYQGLQRHFDKQVRSITYEKCDKDSAGVSAPLPHCTREA